MRWCLLRYTLPLARPLTTGSTGYRQGIVIGLHAEDAPQLQGWGEASPLPGLHSLSLDALQAELVAFLTHRRPLSSPVARFGVEGARLDLAAVRQHRRPAALLATHPATAVPLNGLIDAHHEPVARALQLLGEGYGAAKLKVGRHPLRVEAAAVWAVRAAAPALALRLDANRAWTPDDARDFCRSIQGAGIEYLEEPLRPSVAQDAWDRLYQETGVPLAVDESISEDLDLSTLPEGVRALVIKPTVVGGLSGALRLARRAQARGLRPVLSATFEAGVGLRLLAELAAALGEGLPAQGLATHDWLAEDVLEPAVSPRQGKFLWAPSGRLRGEVCVPLAAGTTALDGGWLSGGE